MVAALLAVGCVRGLCYTGSAELAVCPSAYSCMYPVGYIESPDSSILSLNGGSIKCLSFFKVE